MNNPFQLGTVVATLDGIRKDSGKQVSLADMIVLAGCVAVEKAAREAGFDLTVPFVSGRGDATPAQTDIEAMGHLEPLADGFRNYKKRHHFTAAEEMLIDKAQQLTLTAPEMTVLIGGLRVLDTNFDGSKYGVFTDKPGTLTNDFFANLLDSNTKWSASDDSEQTFEGIDRVTGEKKWTATRVDLIFGSQAELRALAEVYGSDDAQKKFVNDFIAAWSKVMNLDRFDVE